MSGPLASIAACADPRRHRFGRTRGRRRLPRPGLAGTGAASHGGPAGVRDRMGWGRRDGRRFGGPRGGGRHGHPARGQSAQIPSLAWAWHPDAGQCDRRGESTGARLIFPGNIYNFAPDAGVAVDEQAPQSPVSRKGRSGVEMERMLAEWVQAGARSLVIRAGDFFGPGAETSWLHAAMVKPGKPLKSITYPGIPRSAISGPFFRTSPKPSSRWRRRSAAWPPSTCSISAATGSIRDRNGTCRRAG